MYRTLNRPLLSHEHGSDFGSQLQLVWQFWQ